MRNQARVKGAAPDLLKKLSALGKRLKGAAGAFRTPATTKAFEALKEAANGVGRAWSGSWLGYQSRVYYENLEPVPPGARFSIEWGFDAKWVSQGTVGNWNEYSFDSVRDHILAEAKVRSLRSFEQAAKEAARAFEDGREEFLSIVTVAARQFKDPFLDRLKSQAEDLKAKNKFQYAVALRPQGEFMSRDMLAVQQGIQTPPHIAVLAEVCALEDVAKCCDRMADIAQRAASHIDAGAGGRPGQATKGTNVFIGHGRSTAWRDLKDFIQDRIGMPWDEFNRLPIAGITNTTRLSQMLDDAAIAFLVLTGEDEQADASLHPRMNVIHEAGLFQGRLGFPRAIVLLEEGCEEFSNINGLGQIRFPRGNIAAAFEEVRRVLEREGLVK